MRELRLYGSVRGRLATVVPTAINVITGGFKPLDILIAVEVSKKGSAGPLLRVLEYHRCYFTRQNCP
jgi:hypothetical protein